MRLLLLGCSGFIGSELTTKLLHNGHRLAIVSRKKRPINNLYKEFESIQYIQCDPSEKLSWKKESLQNALKNAEGVINLVGEPIANKRWTKQHCQTIQNSRLKTTANLIEAIAQLNEPPKVLIQGSAIGFYGTSEENIFNEESPAGKDFLGKLCKQWESTALQKDKKTRLIILRTGIVLEKDGGALGKMLPVFRSGFGGPLGNGKQWMSWIHRTDLCEIIETALTNDSWSGVFNGVSPQPVQMKYFSQCLGKAIKRPSLIPVPGALLSILLGDGAKVVLEGQQVIPNRLAEIGFQFKYPSLDKALKAITE